jgi:hypothetical protein
VPEFETQLVDIPVASIVTERLPSPLVTVLFGTYGDWQSDCALSQSIPHPANQFLNFIFNIILQSALIYSKSSSPMTFSYKNLA